MLFPFRTASGASIALFFFSALFLALPAVYGQSSDGTRTTGTYSIENYRELFGERSALVIGNGSYEHFSRLDNPAKDGSDVTAKLKSLGFEVNYLEDAELGDMENAVRRFAEDISGADAALFYYAGHGIQKDGENYLIPVEADIQDAADLPSRAMSANWVLDKIEDSKKTPEFSLIVLDACRNDPLGRERSGTRGLSAVSAPSGSMVMYSADAGQVAYDRIIGDGPNTNNSPFAQAFIEAIGKAGVEVSEVYRRVASKVRTYTAGKQRPAMYTSFSGTFSFYPSEAAEALQKARRENTESELSQINEDIENLNAQIEQAKQERENERLAALQKKKEAAEAAAREKKAALQEYESRIAELQERLEEERARREKQKSEAQDQLASIRRRVESRREELEKLSEEVQTISFSHIVERISTLENSLDSIESDFSEQWKEIRDDMEQQAENTRDNIRDLPQEEWETKIEYKEKIETELASFNSDIESDIQQLKNEHSRTREEETKKIRKTLDELYTELSTRDFEIPPSQVDLQFHDFNREDNVFPVTVNTTIQGVKFEHSTEVPLSMSSSKSTGIAEQFPELKGTIEAGGIIADVVYRATRDEDSDRNMWQVDISSVTLRNLSTDEEKSRNVPVYKTIYWFDPVSFEKYAGKIHVSTDSEADSLKLRRHIFSSKSISRGWTYAEGTGTYTVVGKWKRGRDREVVEVKRGEVYYVKLQMPSESDRFYSFGLPLFFFVPDIGFYWYPDGITSGTIKNDAGDEFNYSFYSSTGGYTLWDVHGGIGVNYEDSKANPAIFVYAAIGNGWSILHSIESFSSEDSSTNSFIAEISILPHIIIEKNPFTKEEEGAFIELGAGIGYRYQSLSISASGSSGSVKEFFNLSSFIAKGRVYVPLYSYSDNTGAYSIGLKVQPWISLAKVRTSGISIGVSMHGLVTTFPTNIR